MKKSRIILPILLICNMSQCGAREPLPSNSPAPLQTMLSLAAKHVDTKLLDQFIIGTCATSGALIGDNINTYLLKCVINYNNPSSSLNKVTLSFRDQRWDDDIGYALGLIAGTEVGHFVVHLRHRITDPLVPALWNLACSSTNALKVLTTNCVLKGSGWVIGKINGWNTWMNNYVQKNKQA